MSDHGESYVKPTYWQLFSSFFKIGALTFGGGYVMVAIMYDEFCHRNRYLSQQDLERILMVSQSLPGVMAVNTAAQVGYRFYGWRGSFVSAIGSMLPSFLVILILAEIILRYRHLEIVEDVFFFIRACVVGLLVSAAAKMGAGIYTKPFQLLLLAATVLVMLNLTLNPIILICCAAIAGYAYSKKVEEK